jgi:hypothetical protein
MTGGIAGADGIGGVIGADVIDGGFVLERRPRRWRVPEAGDGVSKTTEPSLCRRATPAATATAPASAPKRAAFISVAGPAVTAAACRWTSSPTEAGARSARLFCA